MKTKTPKIHYVCLLVVLALTLFELKPIKAQEVDTSVSNTNNTEDINSSNSQLLNASFDNLERGTKLRTGTLNFQRLKEYRRQGDGNLGELINMRLDLDFTHIKMLNRNIGLGYKALGTLFIAQDFKGGNITQLAIGPSLRYYLLNKGDVLLYGQGNLLYGQLELGDAVGGVSQNLNLRRDLRIGTTYRLSNSFGIFLEAGPDWEGSNIQQIDSQSFGFQVGVKLFKF